jgi:hypothetical protein
MPSSGWGCMGGGATDQCLEGHHHPVPLYKSIINVLYGTVQYSIRVLYPGTVVQ